MLALECPLCAEEVQLDDRATGHFDCPHCDGEFVWGPERDAFGEMIGSFLGFFFITTLVFFCFSTIMFTLEGEHPYNAMGWTFFLAVAFAPVWVPLALVPFFVSRAWRYFKRLRAN